MMNGYTFIGSKSAKPFNILFYVHFVLFLVTVNMYVSDTAQGIINWVRTFIILGMSDVLLIIFIVIAINFIHTE